MKNLQGSYLNKIGYLVYMGEDKYRELIENSSDAFFLTNPDGSILEMNDVAVNMFGYSRNEFLSLKKHNLFDHIDENIKPAYEKRNQNKYIAVKATGIKKNGEHFPIELSSVIYAESNGTVKTSTMVYDISNHEYKKNEAHGNNNIEIDFKPVIESITDGFFTINNNWIITYWNKEIEKISGIKTADITGKSFLDYFKNLGNQKLYSQCLRAKKENISIRFEELYEKSNIWLEIDAYPSETGLTVFCKNITEQKTAEAAMKISNERYDLVVKATNDLVWDWDILTGEIYRNMNGVLRVYGHSSNENIRSNQLWAQNIHPDDREEIDRLIAYYISSENETSFNFEYRFKREDGKYNDINDKGYIIRNELGIVTRMIGAARDITEQKQIARNITESEQRYKLFVQQSTEGIWRIELDEAKPITTPVDEMIAYCMTNAYIAECNDKFAKTFGFENAEKIKGISLRKIMPAENPQHHEYLERFFTNNFKTVDELTYKNDKEGNKQIFLNNMIGIVEGGFIKRAWGTQRNITQQKKAEQLLLASEEQYRYLFNNNPSCIFIWDPETLSIIEVNEAAVELYGYSRNEFVQLTALDLRPVEEHARFLETVNLGKDIEVSKKTMTWLHLNKKGEGIFMEISSHNIFYKGKKAILAIGNNVTEKTQLEKSLNEERQQRQKQITDAVITGQERERCELAQELHDNINQLLASSRLYIDCARADDNPRKDLLDKGKEMLDSAMKEIRKLSRSLLPPSLGEVSLIEALNDLTIDSFMVNPVEITKNWDDFNEIGLNPKIKLTIFRIVQEQLNNIYKHSQASNVNISLVRNEDHIELTIKDDGVGFDTSTKKTGVGLRNIMSRAEVNNGTVHIESVPGAGCTINVNFMLSE